MKKPASLLRKIAIRMTLTTMGAIVLAYGLLWRDLQSTTDSVRSRSLLDRAHTIARSLSYTRGGTATLALPKAVFQAYDRSNGVDRFSVRDRDGRRLFGAGGNTAVRPATFADTAHVHFYDYDDTAIGPPGVFGIALVVTVGDRELVIQVEHQGHAFLNLVETVTADFLEGHAWLAALFLLALLGVSLATVRSSLAPLRQLSRQAETIGPTTTSVRLPEAGVPREIVPLVRAVNQAFDRLEDGFRILREFTADAAHELRTPLAILTAHIDSLPDRAVATALRRDLDAMTRLIGQLLTAAQIETLRIATDQHADLNTIATDVVAWMAPMAVKAGREMEVLGTESSVVIRGNGEAIFHALRNLVENALTHTPSGTMVTVSVHKDPPSLGVRDHGPGVPEELRERIFQRFWRNRRQSSGSGLGLAIVKQTMQTHGGRVCVGDAEGGGAIFTLEFTQD
ncbi:MAG: ATP-binding protein [Magnetospirillum sp.]|nr:ATP-binding protein [Magnetospirillum sp.]